jgi:hypothetical protein
MCRRYVDQHHFRAHRRVEYDIRRTEYHGEPGIHRGAEYDNWRTDR